jgi:hypothetical protein
MMKIILKLKKMIKKNLKYLFFFLLFLIPSTVLANDLEITCYSNQPPVIVKNTDPLFQLKNFGPGDTASRTMFATNTDTENNCRIYFDVSGDTNILTDKIEVYIPGLFDDTLSRYITEPRILMADLQPNQEISRTITMSLPTNAGNTYSSQKASFDIVVQSEWGANQVNTNTNTDEGQVAGVTDTATQRRTPLEYFSELVETIEGTILEGISDEQAQDNENDGEVLGEKTVRECSEKTLWWIPIVIQLILTLIVILTNKSILKKKSAKLLISILFAIVAYFVTRKIGCSCDPVWLCTHHWVLNTVIGISPITKYFKKRKDIKAT